MSRINRVRENKLTRYLFTCDNYLQICIWIQIKPYTQLNNSFKKQIETELLIKP